ncbi:uncharacterized mitochondrial protein-like protein [Tanacetum coccineum]
MLDDGTIDEYAAKLSGITSKPAMLGEVMSEHKLVKKFLTSLPRHFVHIVAVLEQVLDIKMTGFEDVVGLNIPTGIMTQAEEEDVAQTLEVVDEVEVTNVVRITRKTKVNVTPRKTVKIMNKMVNNMRNVTSRIYSVTVVMSMDTLFQNALNETETMKLTLMRHKRKVCIMRKVRFFMMNHIQEMIFMNEEKYTPPKSDSNSDEDDVWYFDNGVSNHMIGNYSYFSELNENITGRVRFGDGSYVSINRKGLILFQGKNGEQKLLKDVYYILALRNSWGGLLIDVPRSANRLYKAQLKVGKEGTNEVGQKSNEEVNTHSSSVTVHETNPEGEEYKPGSDNTPNPLVRLEAIRLLIALVAGKGWKIHHLDVKTDFLNGDRKKLDSTLKKMGFLQCVHEKTVYRKVPNEEFIIIAVNVDDLFMIGTSLDCINEFKRRIASQFEMSDLGKLTYYLGIEVSQGKDCVEIKQERYARKILKEAGMEDCNAPLYPMEKDLKLSKAEEEPEVEATQY